MLRSLVLCLVFGALGSVALDIPPPETCPASLFGAHPSSTLYATAGLQQALDYCAATCGTVVLDEPGVYLTASLRLSGCVNLRLPANTTLLAGDQREDYGRDADTWHLVRFDGCNRCSLSGAGTIDGGSGRWVLPAPHLGQQARRLRMQNVLRLPGEDGGEDGTPAKAVRNWDDPSCLDPSQCRPRLVGVVDSRVVSVTGITIKDPVYTAIHVVHSEHVDVSGVTISGDWDIRNTDGIVLDGGRYISVTGSNVETAGDALSLKASGSKALEHVDVSDCRLRSRSSAVRVGEEAASDIRLLSFSRLTIEDSGRGLAVQLRDAGHIEHLSFHSISISTRLSHPSWWGAAEPIHVTAVPREPGVKLGNVFDVSFTDVRATGENGIFIAGGPMGISVPGQRRPPQAYSISALKLLRVSLQLVKRSHWPGGCRDYRPSANDSSLGAAPQGWWPAGLDCSEGGTAPIWVAGAQQVSLTDVTVEHGTPARADWRRTSWIDPFNTWAVTCTRVIVT